MIPFVACGARVSGHAKWPTSNTSRNSTVVKSSKPDPRKQSDRRAKGKDRRASDDRRAKDGPVAVEHRQLERRVKVNRRRQIDPTTCERDYSDDEIEFMHALERYKRTSGRMFPTCSEILEVVRGLGYQKGSAAGDNDPPGETDRSDEASGPLAAIIVGEPVEVA
jgi:hypothetical protein